MGVLTQDITRLRNEILALRNERRALLHELDRETRVRQADVSQMLAQFSGDCGTAARTTKAGRLDTISNLKRTVSDVLKGVRSDLSGIRKIWQAMGAPRPRAVGKLENQARNETEPKAERRPGQTHDKRSLQHAGEDKRAGRKPEHTAHRAESRKAVPRPKSSGKRKKSE